MTINLAHRGASAYAPENTMDAFCLGLWMGADGIETDVRRASDGTLVLFHDDSLLRMTGHEGAAEDCDYAQLHALDVSARGRSGVGKIVRFEDFARYFGHKAIVFQIELKTRGIAGDAAEIMRRYGMAPKSHISSFGADMLREAKSAAPDIRTCLLCDSYDAKTASLLKEIKAECVSLRAGTLTARQVREAERDGLSVRAWGVKDAETMLRALDCGVSGMTVNFPDVLKKELKRRGEADNG
jgi:glycerophosphoryl diester phosphodiesterase